jgi:signal transduction histidine kinase
VRTAPTDDVPLGAPGGTGEDEAGVLRGQVRDLAALLALAAMWRGREVSFIAASLLDALVSLLRVDVVYLRLETTLGGEVLEVVRPGKHVANDVGASLYPPHDASPAASGYLKEVPGFGVLRLAQLTPRIDRGRATLILGSTRKDFPTKVESFLMRAAIDQGMVALESSSLLRDLQEANAAKTAFLATMSHELRTPLNAILGYVDLLDAGVAGTLTDQQKGHLGRVRAGSLHLMELIEGILNFARIDAGRDEVHWSKLDVAEVVRDSAALIEPMARAKGLEWNVSIPAEPVWLTTDAAKVRQIVLNLLSNATKFTAAGSVSLRLSRASGAVEFTVKDTGVGIPRQEQERIFEPFRQVGDVYTQKSSGTGLGLSVSRELARMLNGTIMVESEPGRGSAFVLRLPAEPH